MAITEPKKKFKLCPMDGFYQAHEEPRIGLDPNERVGVQRRGSMHSVDLRGSCSTLL